MKHYTGVTFLCFIFTPLSLAASSTSSSETCCHSLQSNFPSITHTLSASPDASYLAILSSYLSNTNRYTATCFVQPNSANQVSQLVSTLSKGKCLFAMKGGGATIVPGASNIQNGVTIDLSKLSNIALSSDNKTVSIGAGAQWGQVYTALDSKGYTVPGARATNVGVAGHTLGGGFNNYNSRYGWTFDLVQDFEIVLGDGTLTNASPNQNVDLFKALKGGGQGNFGIVTRFNFTAVQAGPLWGGLTVYDFKDIGQLYQPMIETTNQSAQYPNASWVMAWTNNATSGNTTAGTFLQYTGNATEKEYYVHTEEAASNSVFPDALSAFSFYNVSLPSSNTLRIDSPYNFATELDPAAGQRYVIGNVLFTAEYEVLANVDRIAQEVLHPYTDNDEPAPYNIVKIEYQPIPRIVTDISDEQQRGNVLGLERVKSNAIQFSILFDWFDPNQDPIIHNLTLTILGLVTNCAKSVPGAFIDFQYVGLAYQEQDPIGSYGQKNIDFLKGVSQKYDPAQVFQKLVPGGFKLGDAGSEDKTIYDFNQFSASGTN